MSPLPQVEVSPARCRGSDTNGARPKTYNASMISREPTLERLAIAQQLLIDPFGLDEAKLSAALARRSRVGSREIIDGL